MPLDFVTVQAFDAYEFERLAVPRAASSDFVLVNLFREPVGAPMRPAVVNVLITAAAHRAGLARAVAPHQLRHAFGSNVADAGGAADEIADLMGHRSLGSTKVYLHPDPARLRAADVRWPPPLDREISSEKPGVHMVGVRGLIPCATLRSARGGRPAWPGTVRQ